MKKITVHASGTYDIHIGSGLSGQAGTFALSAGKYRSVMLVSDDSVFPLYGEGVKKSLCDAGMRVSEFIIPHGEASKSSGNLFALWSAMADAHLSRSDAAVALGGGVVGDLTGFAAATYLRGIDYISIPTSLLAMVDSSVGGKTAVDLPKGKNLAGAFHQPSAVICDPALLSTLPDIYYRDGMAEIIKYGMINRPELLLRLADGGDIADVIYTCIDDKREIVEADEMDRGVRQLLNFGHTVGHAIEKLSDFGISHGFAVAAGMAIITRAAVAMSLCDAYEYERLAALLEKFALPLGCNYSAEALAEAALSDKKITGEKIALIVPVKGERCEIINIPTSELKAIIGKGL